MFDLSYLRKKIGGGFEEDALFIFCYLSVFLRLELYHQYRLTSMGRDKKKTPVSGGLFFHNG